jgi:hypothetical protein
MGLLRWLNRNRFEEMEEEPEPEAPSGPAPAEAPTLHRLLGAIDAPAPSIAWRWSTRPLTTFDIISEGVAPRHV